MVGGFRTGCRLKAGLRTGRRLKVGLRTGRRLKAGLRAEWDYELGQGLFIQIA